MIPRLLLISAALAALLAFAGCGGGDSSSDLAGAAPPDSLLFVEGKVRPNGALKSDVEALATRIAGIEDLGGRIASELEKSARDSNRPFDFEKEVEPWLGERGAAFFEAYDGNDFSEGAVLLQSTDTEATQRFIDSQAANGDEPARSASYEGVDYKVSDETAIGVVDQFLVVAEDEESFKHVVDAADGESLAGEDRFKTASSSADEGSLADLYVDVGRLIKASGGGIDEQALQILRSAGIDPRDATALASVVPGTNQIEIDLSSDLGGEEAPSGDASDLLGSLPGDSFAAFAVSGFGGQLEEALDSLDASGIPGQIPPHKLKSGLKEAGIDLDQIVGSLGDAGVFAEGRSESGLGGALVLVSENSNQAANTVSNIALLLRNANTPGVSVVTGKARGFSIRSEDLGRKPLVVIARDGRIAIGYGVRPAYQGLAASGGKTLSDNPAYGAAVSALGDVPISAFADGPAALRLAQSLVPRSDSGFREATPYLAKISYLGLGSAPKGDLATAKLIIGLEK